MPKLAKIPGKLTIREAMERLKKNPDDPNPELQEFKKTSEELVRLFIPTRSQFSTFYENFDVALNTLRSTTNFFSEVLRPDYSFVKTFAEMAESQRRIIEAFTMPNYFFENLMTISNRINQMYEPIRLLSQSFAIYYTPNLFNQLTQIDTNWVIPGYVEAEKKRPVSPKAYTKEIVKEKQIFVKELSVLEESTLEIEKLPYYYYEQTQTLLFKVTTLAVIPLYTKRGNTDIALLITTLLYFLKVEGKIVGEYQRVFVPIRKLIAKLVAQGQKDITMEWIKNTRSNFMNHKVPDILRDVIRISDFDKEAQGYYFEIKVTCSLPKILT